MLASESFKSSAKVVAGSHAHSIATTRNKYCFMCLFFFLIGIKLQIGQWHKPFVRRCHLPVRINGKLEETSGWGTQADAASGL